MTAEQAPLEPLVRRVLQRWFGASANLVRLDRLTGGASQETYRLETNIDGVPKTFALRRAAGGTEHSPSNPHPGLAVEATLFSLARNAGIPEPEVFGVLEPSDGLGPGFLLEWLEGETLGARIVRSDRFAEVRPRLARQCGEILGRIHTIDPDQTGLRDQLAEQTPEQFVHDMWSRYQTLDTCQPMIDYTALWLLQNLPELGAPKLVHNDFRNGNLMVSPEDGVIAVLDWELAHLGDPIRDLGWICCNSWRFGGGLPVGGFGTREDLFTGYQAVTGTAVDPDHVHFWEVFGSFWWAVSTLTMAQASREGLDPSVERVAVGRRTSECQMDCVNLLFPGTFDLAEPPPQTSDLADQTELLEAVAHFLRGDVMHETKGRVNFLSRVAANAIDIVLRESAQHEAHLRLESERLSQLGCTAAENVNQPLERTLGDQRRDLISRLKSGDLALDDTALQAHLRQTAAQQLAIDQPKYSALR